MMRLLAVGAMAWSLLSLSACATPLHRGGKDDLYILTSLPLFWGEGDVGDVLTGRSSKAPIISALETQRRLLALETVEKHALRGVSLLMIAQPRRLAPQELVALDSWVRRGGRLLIFSDPMLDWPSAFALGDTRRAPPVGLLDPLFVHWGIEMGDANMALPKLQIGDIGRQRVATVYPGGWTATSRHCVVESALLARCRVGRGVVILVADADMLNAAVWRAPGAANEPAILGLVERVATEKIF